MRWSNLRLGVMFLACCAALYGQFGAAFPKYVFAPNYFRLLFRETLKIAACVVVYFALSGIVTAMDYFILKDSNLVIKDNSVGEVFVGLTMRKGESHVTMSMRGKPGKEEFRVDIGKLFDTDGVLLQTPMMDLFVRNFNSFIKSDKKKN